MTKLYGLLLTLLEPDVIKTDTMCVTTGKLNIAIWVTITLRQYLYISCDLPPAMW